MDTPQLHSPTTNASRYLLFAGIMLVAVVSVVLAVVLPKLSGDIRNQAWTSAACAGSVNVNLSACNEGCSQDTHCATGMICYKANGAAEGVCRNPQYPTSTTCAGITPPPGTPTPTPTPKVTPPPTTAACTKTCTFNYDCNLSAGETCVGTNANNGTASIVANAPRAATSTELAQLASDQTIFMGPGNDYKPDASGKMPFSVISKKATTFFVRIYDITAAKGSLDPQKLVLEKSFSIGANQVVTGTVTIPHCGRYQVDYGSLIVAGTPYEANTIGHYFWGTVFEVPCQSGCCELTRATTTTNPETQPFAAPSSVGANASGLGVVNVRVINTTSQTVLGQLTSGFTASKSQLPPFTIAADIFPANLKGSLKFELNGAQVQMESFAPYSIKGDTNGVFNAWSINPGTYTLKITPYSQESGAGQIGEAKTFTFTVTQ